MRAHLKIHLLSQSETYVLCPSFAVTTDGPSFCDSVEHLKNIINISYYSSELFGLCVQADGFYVANVYKYSFSTTTVSRFDFSQSCDDYYEQ